MGEKFIQPETDRQASPKKITICFNECIRFLTAKSENLSLQSMLRRTDKNCFPAKAQRFCHSYEGGNPDFRTWRPLRLCARHVFSDLFFEFRISNTYWLIFVRVWLAEDKRSRVAFQIAC
jgi:hypothetical protein